jgi:hypothetical protein
MSDDQNPLGRDLQRLVRVDWSATRAHRSELGLAVRRRRKITRTAILAAAAAGALAFTVWPSQDEPSPPEVNVANVANVAKVATVTIPSNPPVAATPSPPAPAPPTPTHAALRFSAGATATPMAADAKLRVVGETSDRIVVALDAGAARFDVAETPARTFRLVAPRPRRDDVAIDVIVAKFAVVRETHRVHIEVYEGLLQISSRDGVRELGAGATYDVPTTPPRPVDVVATVVKQDPAPTAVVQPDVVPARDVLEELLLAADRKRQAGHHEEAVELLRQGVRDHAADSRAPLAAFTLGRLLLRLKRPAEAAEAFATAERLAPNGPMTQDAVARQVEAMAAAGNTNGARAVAQAYVTRFPDGRRLAEVRSWGGL